MPKVANIPVRVIQSFMDNHGNRLTEIAINVIFGDNLACETRALVEGQPLFITKMPGAGDILTIPVECIEINDTGKRERECERQAKPVTVADFAEILHPLKVLVYGNGEADRQKLKIYENGFEITSDNYGYSPKYPLCAFADKSMNFSEFTDFVRKRLYLCVNMKNYKTLGLWKSILYRYVDTISCCRDAWRMFVKNRDGKRDAPGFLFDFADFMKVHEPTADFFSRLVVPIRHIAECVERKEQNLFEIREFVSSDYGECEMGRAYVKREDFDENHIGDICINFIACVD